MRDLFKFLLLAAVAVCTTACSLDKLDSGFEGEQTGEMGYLQLGEVLLNGDTETANLNSQSSRSTTRATEATSSYFVEIVDSEGNVDYSGSYSEAKNQKISLEPGTYVVYAYQDESKGGNIADVAEDAPYYQGKSEAVVVKSKQTTSATVTCKMANIRTTVELSADLKAVFDVDAAASPLQTLVSLGTNEENQISYTFAYTSTHEAPMMYYKDVAGPNSQVGNTMTFTLSGVYYTGDPDDIGTSTEDGSLWKEVKMVKTITNVRAAQWRKISIDIDHNVTGTVKFIFTVSNVVYDDEINVDVETLYASLNVEEVIPDDDVENPLAPNVTIHGQEGLNYAINGSMYNSNAGSWMAFLQADVVATEGSTVEEIYAVVASTNTSLVPAMAAAGYADARVDLFPENGASTYCNVASDGTSVTLKNDGMSALYKYEGTHTISVYTVDSEKRKKHTDIVVEVTNEGGSSGAGPQIVWMGDNGPTNSITIVTGTEKAEADVISATGLTGLSVVINSNALTADILGELGLTTSMDLFNPTSAKMETQLRKLGFLPIENYHEGMSDAEKQALAVADDNYRKFKPTDSNGEVGEEKAGFVSPLQGVKSVNFKVTPFMALLPALGASESKFELSATDESGTNKGTMTLIVK